MSMSDDDDLLAAVNAKLAAIAEASATPPTWYDDWMRLKPESTHEERLAVSCLLFHAIVVEAGTEGYAPQPG